MPAFPDCRNTCEICQSITEGRALDVIEIDAGIDYRLRALEQADLRKTVKVMVGGAPVTQAFADEVGADAYGDSAATAVDKAKELLGVV